MPTIPDLGRAAYRSVIYTAQLVDIRYLWVSIRRTI
jgi:hypothetical protein